MLVLPVFISEVPQFLPATNAYLQRAMLMLYCCLLLRMVCRWQWMAGKLQVRSSGSQSRCIPPTACSPVWVAGSPPARPACLTSAHGPPLAPPAALPMSLTGSTAALRPRVAARAHRQAATLVPRLPCTYLTRMQLLQKLQPVMMCGSSHSSFLWAFVMSVQSCQWQACHGYEHVIIDMDMHEESSCQRKYLG